MRISERGSINTHADIRKGKKVGRPGDVETRRRWNAAGSAFLERKTMSTYERRKLESTRTDAETLPTDVHTEPVFGIDAVGREHRWSRHFDRIVVTNAAGEVVHTEAVTDDREMTLRANATDRPFDVPKTVADWVRFVDDEIGWVGTWLDAETAPEATERRREAEREVGSQ